MVESSGFDLDLIFRALGDPTRRSILRDVARRRRTISEVARPFRMSLAAVSKHVKVLERAKLIRRDKRGSYSHVSLNPAALRTADQWVAYYRRFWDARLESLKTLLEENDR